MKLKSEQREKLRGALVADLWVKSKYKLSLENLFFVCTVEKF
jgi:hypothetical protein